MLIKMCERLSYLDGENRPSGMSRRPWPDLCDHQVLDLRSSVKLIAPNACGFLISTSSRM